MILLFLFIGLLSCQSIHAIASINQHRIPIEGSYLMETTNHKCCAQLRKASKTIRIMITGRYCFVNIESDSIESAQALVTKTCGDGYNVVEDLTANIATPTASWGLDRIDQVSNKLDGQFDTPYDGTGVSVFVLDSGIYIRHNDFEGRASYGTSMVKGGKNANDQNGHGTHCAGIIGSNTYGVAKNVNLVAVQVLDSTGIGAYSNIIAGVDWVIKNRLSYGDKHVISMSIEGPAYSLLDNALEDAANAGIIVAVAAGNNNDDACGYSPSRSGLNSPILTIGATDESDVRASFSNYGSCVDIFAPGVDIESTWIGSTTATKSMSGTSMSTPFVAGAAALFLQKHNGDVNAALADLNGLAIEGVVSNSGSSNQNFFVQVDSASQDVINAPGNTSAPIEIPIATVAPTETATSGPTSPAPTVAPTTAPTKTPALRRSKNNKL